MNSVSVKVEGGILPANEMPFERIRRITGYLVGSLERFNNAKRTEVADRVKHELTDDLEDVYLKEGADI